MRKFILMLFCLLMFSGCIPETDNIKVDITESPNQVQVKITHRSTINQIDSLEELKEYKEDVEFLLKKLEDVESKMESHSDK